MGRVKEENFDLINETEDSDYKKDDVIDKTCIQPPDNQGNSEDNFPEINGDDISNNKEEPKEKPLTISALLEQKNKKSLKECAICKSTQNIHEIPLGLSQTTINNVELCEKHGVELKLKNITDLVGSGNSVINQEVYAKKIYQTQVRNLDDNDHEAERLLDALYNNVTTLAKPKGDVIFSEKHIEAIEKLEKTSPNAKSFFEHIKCSLFESLHNNKTNRAFEPILLAGPAGVGKTRMSNLIAEALGIEFVSIQVSTMTSNFEFSGLSAQWRTPSMGRMTEALNTFSSHQGVILLDELDKTHINKEHGSVYESLHALLEEDTCNTFYNNLIQLPMRTSGILWIATGNNLQNIPKTIRSRFTVIEIENFDSNQLKTLIDNFYHSNCKKWIKAGYKCREIDKKVYELAEDLSIREIKNLISFAVKKSAFNNKKNKIISLSREAFLDDKKINDVFSQMSKNLMALH